jgi:hypothetical protein
MDFKVTNLLDSKAEVYQGDELIETYKPGMTMSLTFWAKY